jgi:predicted transport protein
MPQNEEMRPEWRQMLGVDWQRVHSSYLHTLGNLTLTGYNSEYSDKPFLEKRDMTGGFAQSPLKVNEGLGQLEAWNEDQIVARAQKLANLALRIWDYPYVEPLILAAMQPPKAIEATEYTLESYPQLQNPTVLELFEALRKEVLSLDPVVAEVCRFGYIAYKAETNFVDVEPQSKRLKLYLNIPFMDLNDPRSISRDVTNIGTWGNGDVEVILEKSEDLHYIMGLVRQSFERQTTIEDQ